MKITLWGVEYDERPGNPWGSGDAAVRCERMDIHEEHQYRESGVPFFCCGRTEEWQEN